MVGHGGSSAGLYLANPTSPIPSHFASIVSTSTLRVNVLGENLLSAEISQTRNLFIGQKFQCHFYNALDLGL